MDEKNMIRRYLFGELDESEYEIMRHYLNDPEKRMLFEAEKAKWNENPELDGQTHRNLFRLKYRIEKENEATERQKYIRRKWIYSVAASLLAILFMGGLFINHLTHSYGEQETLVFETPRGEKSNVTLPDGSKVWMNANTRMVYHLNTDKERRVEFTGEAYFEVFHNDKKPFNVYTNDCKISVLGTKFNVMAYKEFGRKEITLLEGCVHVNSGKIQEVLKPGNMLVLNNTTAKTIPVNTSLYTCWVKNKFYFKDIPLSELIKRLENWYDLDISLENKTGKEVNFTGTFKNEETIWQVLDAIKIYLPITYSRKDLRKVKITVL